MEEILHQLILWYNIPLFTRFYTSLVVQDFLPSTVARVKLPWPPQWISLSFRSAMPVESDGTPVEFLHPESWPGKATKSYHSYVVVMIAPAKSLSILQDTGLSIVDIGFYLEYLPKGTWNSVIANYSLLVSKVKL